MQVADVMTRSVTVTTPTTSLAEAARLMVQNRISGLPVVDDSGQAVGMLTEADVLRRGELGTDTQANDWRALFTRQDRLAHDYVRMHGQTVGDVMTRGVIWVQPTTPLPDAVALMQSRRIKRLPVLSDGRIVGILSRADLLRVLSTLLSRAPAPSGSDAAIKEKILTQLRRQRWCAASLITVEVQDGRAELHGVVISEAERQALKLLVANTPGVREVVDQLIWVEPYTGTTIELPGERL